MHLHLHIPPHLHIQLHLHILYTYIYIYKWFPPTPHRDLPVYLGGTQVTGKLHTAWAPPGHRLGTSWAPPGNHLGTTWAPPGHRLGTAWAPPGYHVGTTWGPPGDHLGTTWAPPGHIGYRTICCPWLDLLGRLGGVVYTRVQWQPYVISNHRSLFLHMFDHRGVW